MTRRLFLVTIAIALLAGISVSAQSWYELYDDAIRDVNAGRWAQAETKLLQARKSGPASGDRVRRYSNIYDHFFPEFFLGVVYLEMNRPEQAQAQFKLARAAKIDNARDARFRQIAEFEKRAQSMLVARATPVVPPTAPPPVKNIPTPTPTPVPPVDPLAAVRKQFAGTITDARAQLSQRNYARADQLARSARNLADQNKMGAQREEAETLIGLVSDTASSGLAEALKRRDAQAARQAYAQLVAVLPNAAEPFLKRLEALEGEVKAIAAAAVRTEALSLQRQAMTAFHTGNYSQTLNLLASAEKLAPLTPRGHFYRACGQAALALTMPSGNAVKAKQLQDDARRSYQAAQRGASEFRRDLQWVSPGILQLFGLK
jgi:hypothetical protein